MVFIVEIICVFCDILDKAKENIDNLNIIIRHDQYIAISEILIITNCKSVAKIWRKLSYSVSFVTYGQTYLKCTCCQFIFFLKNTPIFKT